jgi:TRAP transporter TAXI family solute receptor
MKKFFLIPLSIIIVSALILGGCSAPSPTVTPTPAPKPTPAPIPAPTTSIPKTIIVGSNEPGSLLYPMSIAIGDQIAKKTSTKVESVTQGSTVWFPMMQTREVDFGIEMIDGSWGGYKGLYIFNEPTKGKGYDMRTLLVGGPSAFAMTVADDSPVQTIKDLKGKRVITEVGIIFSAGLSAKAVLANGGLSVNDVVQVSASSLAEATEMMISGKADGYVQAMGSAQHKQAQSAGKARAVPIDPSPEAMARMTDVFAGYFAMKATPDVTGLKESAWVEGKDVVLVARTDLSDDAAYMIVKTVWESLSELEPVNPRFKAWKAENFASLHAVIPYHPGSIKWFKEKGVWTKELEEYQAKLLKK